MERKLVCGLEVHQQLDTGKLFCRCPTALREESPDFVFTRKIRPVPSELGTFDSAAVEAFQKGYKYEYEAYSESNCLIELDEEPVREMDEEALDTALTVSIMAKSNIVDEIQVMRKAVADGSVTSAFQRTALIALGGSIEVNGKSIRLLSISLEEDAARVMKRDEENKTITYRLDRLGIPLIEIATQPDIDSAEEAQQVALAIGTLLRRTCKSKRGLGTIRQDVNISVPGGARVEIKGCQELGMIGEYVRREAQRQQSLIETMESLKRKGITPEKFRKKTVFVLSHHFEKSESKLFRHKNVFGIKLEGFAGLMGKELQPGRRLGTEFASYVRARTGLKGIIHSDELPGYGVSEEEKRSLSKSMDCGDEDAFVLVIGKETPVLDERKKPVLEEKELKKVQELAERAFEVVIARAIQCLHGVPEETRNALEEGNSEYSRPLPGAARMYPETDLKTIAVEEKKLNALRKRLPKTPEERVQLYQRWGLSEQLAEKMKLDNWACGFEEWVENGVDAKTAAVLLLEGLTKLKRDGFRVERLSKAQLLSALLAAKEKKVQKEALAEMVGVWSENPQLELSALIGLSGEKVGAKRLEEMVEKLLNEKESLVKEKGMQSMGPLMGLLMKELRGKASGKEISEALEKAIQKRQNA